MCRASPRPVLFIGVPASVRRVSYLYRPALLADHSRSDAPLRAAPTVGKVSLGSYE